MHKSQIAGVQQQARCLGSDIRRRVQRIAQDGVAQGLQVDAQLVAAPGNGLQLQPAGGSGSIHMRHTAPAGLAGLAARIHAAQGAGFPVRPNRQIDQLPEGVHGEQAVHDCHIGLIDLAGFKQRAQSPLHVRTTRHQHQAAGGHVQPVDHQGIRVQRLHPRAQAVLLIGATARHGQEAGRFVQDQQAVVGKDDVHTADRRGRFQGLPR